MKHQKIYLYGVVILEPDIQSRMLLFFTEKSGYGTAAERSAAATTMNSSQMPTIMKKRGYEQTNGIDGPAAKRPAMGVIRQAGSVRPQPGMVSLLSYLQHAYMCAYSRICLERQHCVFYDIFSEKCTVEPEEFAHKIREKFVQIEQNVQIIHILKSMGKHTIV